MNDDPDLRKSPEGLFPRTQDVPVILCAQREGPRIRSQLTICLFLTLTHPAIAVNLPQRETSFIKGVDVSMLHQIENSGGIYTEDGISRDAIEIFRDHGINCVRLRTWHTPDGSNNNLSETLLMAARVRDAGLGLLLDFHYSDSWADPGQQTKPAAWQSILFEALKDSVYQYTRDVITALRDQNSLPDIVQIGNEIICGMLWDDGRVCDPYNTFDQWNQFGELLNEGIRGVRESLVPNDTVQLMIHIDRGGDNAGSRWFFDSLLARNVSFDLIGLSFYPWWHGTLGDLQMNLNDLGQRYSKPIVVVEAAYPWTLAWYDSTHNLVGDSTQLHAGYPASVQGQGAFLLELMRTIEQVPNEMGLGVFYWAPEWIPAPQVGSPWENLTLFGFDGEALGSLSVFDSTLTSLHFGPSPRSSFRLSQNYPNPFNPITTFHFTIFNSQSTILRVYDVLGREVATVVNEKLAPGIYTREWDATKQPSGVYFYRLSTTDFVQTKKLVLLR